MSDETKLRNAHFAASLRELLAGSGITCSILESGDFLKVVFHLSQEDLSAPIEVTCGPGRDGSSAVHFVATTMLPVDVSVGRRAPALHFARLFGLLNQPFSLEIGEYGVRLSYAALFHPGYEASFPAMLRSFVGNARGCRSGLAELASTDASAADAEAVFHALWPMAAEGVDDAESV